MYDIEVKWVSQDAFKDRPAPADEKNFTRVVTVEEIAKELESIADIDERQASPLKDMYLADNDWWARISRVKDYRAWLILKLLNKLKEV